MRATPAGRTARSLWTFGPLQFDERTLQLSRNGESVAIEPKPQQLLLLLLRRAGEVITREEILEAIWPGRVVTDGAITNCVAKVRAALCDEQQEIVRTVQRYGYRLVAEVRRQSVAETEVTGVHEQMLRDGDALPGREGWCVAHALSLQGQAEVRLIVHADTGERRVVKIARNATELAALKREVTLNRVLQETLDQDDTFVRVLDWNFDEAPFFITLEYSEHGDLTHWCKNHGGIAALPMSDRLELAAQCAAAVSAAHSAGVLHKDLKPSNIIVTLDEQGRPRIRLSDFAAGWVLDPEVLERLSATRLGFTRIAVDDSDGGGTPMYVAPEVIAGHMTTARADIYALGVILYQLVVGDFRAVPAPGWEAQVADPLIRDDIAMAANGDPARRFTNALQLAEHLRSLNARRAVLATQHQARAQAETTRLALVRATARRGLLVTLAITLSLASIAIGLLYWEARIARDDAIRQSHTASAISAFLTEDLLSAADPRTSGNGDLRVRELLDIGSETLDTRFADSPVVKAQLQRVIGSAYGSLGEIAKAEPLLLAAEATLAAHLGDAATDTQATRLSLRDAYRIAVRFKRMGAVGRRIVGAEERAGIPNPAIWFEGRWIVIFTDCLERDGSIWLANCAAPLRSLADEAAARLGEDDAVVSRIHWITGVTMVYNGHAREAEPELRQAADGLRKTLGQKDSRYIEARLYWGAALGAAGKQSDALREIESVVSSFGDTFGRNQSLYRVAQVFYARALVAEGRYDDAEAQLRDALSWRLSTEGPGAVTTLNGLESLADLLLKRNRAVEAVTLLSDALRRAEDAKTLSPYERIRLNTMLAYSQRLAGHEAEAGGLLHSAVSASHTYLRNDQWYLGVVLGQWGNWLVGNGRRAEGLPFLEEASRIIDAALPADHPQRRHAMRALAAARDAAATLPMHAPSTMPDFESPSAP